MKISEVSNDKLGNLCKISGGITTSSDKVTNSNRTSCTSEEILKHNINAGDGIFVINNRELSDLNLEEKEMKYIKPFFKNSDIKKYFVKEKAEKHLVYSTHRNAEEIKGHPNIFNHLCKFESILKNRKPNIELQNAFNKGHWFVVSNGRDRIDFNKEKIICPYRAKENIFGYTNNTWFAGRDVYFLVEFIIEPKFLLALLNSKLYKFWLKFKGKRKGFIYELLAEPLRNIPLRVPKINDRKQIINLIDNILNLKHKNRNETISIETRINNSIYDLYGLTNDEIHLIEEEV